MERGVLRQEADSQSWVFPAQRYTTLDGTERGEVRARLRFERAALHDRSHEVHAVVIRDGAMIVNLPDEDVRQPRSE